jgi:Mrp family chromosome partitioning ATPase
VASLAAPFTVERQLDQLVDRLSGLEASPAVRALLIEARRLRSIIANWQSVPPLPSVREEMLARVLHVSAAVGDAVPPSGPYGTSRALGDATTGIDFDRISAESNGRDPERGSSSALVRANAGTHLSMPHYVAPTTDDTVIGERYASLPETSLDVCPVELPRELSPNLVMFNEPHGKRADAYRALRHRLARLGDPKVIGVTSAGRREGKTTAAINLAASLREGARGRVLLLEANLRAPAISTMLGFLPPVCFGDQLAQHRRAPLAPWTAADLLSPLHVMAVSPTWRRSPLLDPIAFSIAIDRLRMAGYDYIVVDTSPVLDSADVNLIADSVDGLLLTVLAKRSNAKALRRAMNQIGTMAFLGTLLLS